MEPNSPNRPTKRGLDEGALAAPATDTSVDAEPVGLVYEDRPVTFTREVAEELLPYAIWVEPDVSDEEALQRLIRRKLRMVQRVDGLLWVPPLYGLHANDWGGYTLVKLEVEVEP